MVLFNNTKAMVKNGHDVHVMVGQKGTLTARLEELNVPVTLIPSLKRKISLKNDIQCYRTMRKLLHLHHPDIVISHSSKAGILCRLACYRNGIRNIFTVHGWSFTPGVKGMKRYMYLIIEKIMGRFTDHLIAVSEFDYNLALKNNIVPDSRMRVVYNGSPDLLEENALKASPVLTVLMTARFSYQKDHMTLFKALSMLKEAPIHVDLVGSGQSMPQYVALSEEMGIDHLITFHGESDKIPFFLNKADIFVLTSKFEGLPLSICEAMSVGIPVLATNVGGVSEMVTNDHNGYLIPKEDHVFLAEKLKTLIDNRTLLKTLGENSRKTFNQKFSIDQMAIATQEYINVILQKS